MNMEKKNEGLLEAMYSHLNAAYLANTKGQNEKLNSIIEQLVKPSKPFHQICSWVDMFTRLIIQLTKSHQDPKIIIDIVLYKIPWFSSENHLKALQSFKMAIMTIISLMPQQIQSVYQLLVAQLNIEIDTGSNDNQSVTINKRQFDKKENLINEVQDLLQSIETINEDSFVTLEPTHHEFMRLIFQHHPNATAKLEGLKSIAIGYFPARKATKCFYIVRNDGSVEDISYLKSIDNLYENLHRTKQMEDYQSHGQQFYQVMKLIQELDIINKLHQTKLLQLLHDNYPHKSRPLYLLRTYTTNLLYLADMIPSIRARIIKIIVTNLLSLDLEIKSDGKTNFHTYRKNQKNPELRDDMTKKLDELLSILLDYMQSKLDQSYQSKTNWTQNPQKREQIQLIDIYKELSKLFFENILKNQHCNMVHFLYLYLCGQQDHPRVQQLFISRLILNVTDKREPLSKQQRINSIFYLSSLLLKCQSVKDDIVVRTMEILINHSREELSRYDGCWQSKVEILMHFEVLLQTVQMLVQVISCKSSVASNKQLISEVIQFLLEIHNKISALSFVNIDVISRFNEFLLRQTNSVEPNVEKLIEITAEIHRKQFERGSVSPQSKMLSPCFQNTPTIMDPESYYSKNSAWTCRNKQYLSKAGHLEIDFTEPFSHPNFVYSESILSRYQIHDTELAQQSQCDRKSPISKRKALEPPCQTYEKIIKRIK